MRHRADALRLALGSMLVLACVHDDDGGGDDGAMEMPLALVDATAWTVADPAADLFASMRPADVECDPQRGYYLQETAWATLFEINTGWCNYVTVTQPSLEALEAGDTIAIRVYHYELTGGPAEGYVGVALGSEIIWEDTVPIPSDGELLEGNLPVTTALAAGTPIQLHIHNHGINTWEIYSIDKLSPQP